MVNKRGEVPPTIMIIGYVFLVFFIVIFLGVVLYAMGMIDNVFSSINIDLGDVAFNTTYNETLKPVITNAQTNMDWMGIALIFGMIIVMIICAFIFRNKNHLMIIFDLFIIIVVFIISVVLKTSYNTFINSSSELFSVYSTNLVKSSTFLLKLPSVVAITGALILIVSYVTINRKPELNVYGEVAY